MSDKEARFDRFLQIQRHSRKTTQQALKAAGITETEAKTIGLRRIGEWRAEVLRGVQEGLRQQALVDGRDGSKETTPYQHPETFEVLDAHEQAWEKDRLRGERGAT